MWSLDVPADPRLFRMLPKILRTVHEKTLADRKSKFYDGCLIFADPSKTFPCFLKFGRNWWTIGQNWVTMVAEFWPMVTRNISMVTRFWLMVNHYWCTGWPKVDFPFPRPPAAVWPMLIDNDGNFKFASIRLFEAIRWKSAAFRIPEFIETWPLKREGTFAKEDACQ